MCSVKDHCVFGKGSLCVRRITVCSVKDHYVFGKGSLCVR